MPRVSLIIATHSRPGLLPRAVESALAAGTDVEVIISDDGSTDETREVSQRLAAQHSNVRVVRSATNHGVAAARNLGLQAATGQYLGFLDDDDIRLPGSLDRQLDYLENTPGAAWCYAQAFTGDENCNPIGEPQPATLLDGDLFFPLLSDNSIHCLTVIFQREALDAMGPLDENLPGCDDWDLWLRLAEKYPAAALPEPVAVWRTASPDSGQGTSNYADLLTRCARAHREKWQQMPRAKAEPERTRAAEQACFENFVNMLVWHAAQGLEQGHKAYSRSNLVTALKLNPRRALQPGILRLLARTYL